MALIAMCCYDTEENKRSWMTRATLESLYATVDFKKHRLIVVDNNSCEETRNILSEMSHQMGFEVITLPENIGTAKAINLAWKHRRPQEHLIKMDNDVVIHNTGWVDLLEEAIGRDPETIGQASLKRKDLAETPDTTNEWYKSELIMLPHQAGQRWIVGEKVIHCMGTCVMHNYRLIDKVGGLHQMGGIYGFDDSLMSLRSRLSGFKNLFIHGIEIDHIDSGDNPYSEEKRKYAGTMMEAYSQAREEYTNGIRSLYEEL